MATSSNEKQYDLDHFYNLGLETIKMLEVPTGVLASSANEMYGCIFGRDSLITSLKLMKAYEYDPNPYYLFLTKKILEGLMNLQGKEINIESGEEPGKCIHEFRPSKHEHLTQQGIPPWYIYPDGSMKNYDSIDATPLFLISIYRYMQKSGDKAFSEENISSINLAIDWILTYGDKNNDGFIDYQLHPERKYGGLDVQSWMDSSESVFHEDDTGVVAPIAPVEAQAYVYLAFTLWSKYFQTTEPKKSDLLHEKSLHIKQLFNHKFVMGESTYPIFAHAIDNLSKPLISLRSSIGHILWASNIEENKKECILEDICIPGLIKRLLEPDIFESEAGIRTLSKDSRLFNPISYHNGSIWPHDNSLIAEGMENFGYKKEANEIRLALFSAYSHFQTPIELFVYTDGTYMEWKKETGQISCQLQAWSAAAMIADALALKSNE